MPFADTGNLIAPHHRRPAQMASFWSEAQPWTNVHQSFHVRSGQSGATPDNEQAPSVRCVGWHPTLRSDRLLGTNMALENRVVRRYQGAYRTPGPFAHSLIPVRQRSWSKGGTRRGLVKYKSAHTSRRVRNLNRRWSRHIIQGRSTPEPMKKSAAFY